MYASKIYAKVEIHPYAGQRFIRGFMNNSWKLAFYNIANCKPKMVSVLNLLSNDKTLNS